MEGYEDILSGYDQAPNRTLDLLIPIWFIPEIVAFSLALYVWKFHQGENNVTSSIFHLFTTLFLYALFSIISKIAKLGMCLNGARDYNFNNYIASIIALLFGLAPWIYQYKKNQQSIKSNQ